MSVATRPALGGRPAASALAHLTSRHPGRLAALGAPEIFHNGHRTSSLELCVDAANVVDPVARTLHQIRVGDAGAVRAARLRVASPEESERVWVASSTVSGYFPVGRQAGERDIRLWGRNRTMPLFRRQQLPMTSYGYQPPREAFARGWHCVTDGCGAVGDDVPRRWPFSCPHCGGPTGPALPDPWQHEALGAELRHRLASGFDDGGFSEMQWPLWQFKDALLNGDVVAANRARADLRAIDAQRSSEGWWSPGDGHFILVWEALAAGELDSAADDLVHWLNNSNSEGVETDNSRRTNCRQAVESACGS
jgi:hypothetical protein